MRFVNREILIEGLQELADHDFQVRVWTASQPDVDEISSFTEAVENVFDDSRFSEEFDAFGKVFSRQIDRLVIELGAKIDRFREEPFTVAQIDSSDMQEVRDISKKILKELDAPTRPKA